MHCSSCAMSIDGDLEDTQGIKSSSTNYTKAITEVAFDNDKISKDDVISIIKKTGYTATLQNS